MAYKLLAVDLDNTLLTGPVGVSPANRDALTRAEGAGCRVVLCSGRGRYTTRPVVEELPPLSGPHIVFNGGATFSSFAEDPDEVLLLPRLAVEECLRAARPLEIGFSGFEDPRLGDRVHLARPTDGLRRWAGMNTERTVWVKDPKAILSHRLVAFLLWGAETEVQRLQERLGHPVGLAEPRLSANRLVDSHLLELSAAGGTKGEALARVARRLRVPRSAVVAVGDAAPDISMIQYAGLGVAMGNAKDEVKAAADYVAPPCDEDGVAHVVERFILK